jgi:hypothetical protein
VFTIHVSANSPSGRNLSLPSMYEITQMNQKFLLENQFQQPDTENFLKKVFFKITLKSFFIF